MGRDEKKESKDLPSAVSFSLKEIAKLARIYSLYSPARTCLAERESRWYQKLLHIKVGFWIRAVAIGVLPSSTDTILKVLG